MSKAKTLGTVAILSALAALLSWIFVVAGAAMGVIFSLAAAVLLLGVFVPPIGRFMEHMASHRLFKRPEEKYQLYDPRRAALNPMIRFRIEDRRKQFHQDH